MSQGPPGGWGPNGPPPGHPAYRGPPMMGGPGLPPGLLPPNAQPPVKKLKLLYLSYLIVINRYRNLGPTFYFKLGDLIKWQNFYIGLLN